MSFVATAVAYLVCTAHRKRGTCILYVVYPLLSLSPRKRKGMNASSLIPSLANVEIFRSGQCQAGGED